MPFREHSFSLATIKPLEVVDVTSQVKSFVEACGLKAGLLHVASRHTTMGVVINERCEKLQEDMIDFLKRLAPPGRDYRHDTVASDGRPNAHSHLLSLVLPSQVTMSVANGRLNLGEWQSLFAVELDGPRPSRKIHLTWIGE